MSFPRYPSYKDGGVEWLGEVPAHWEVTALKRVGSIRYGIGEPPKYHDQGTPLIRATNIHAGNLFTEGLVYVDPAEIPAQRIVWLSGGDIIVVRSGAYTGDSAIIPRDFGPCIAGFDMVLKCHSARPEFLQFALLSQYLKDGQIDLEKMRAAQPHLNAEELGSCVVAMPDANEQMQIAEFLDRETGKIDELVAEQQRLMALLKEKRQALISQAVTRGLSTAAPLKPSGIEWLGDVPAHWEVRKLKFLCNVETGGKDTENAVADGKYPFFVRSQTVERINSMAFDCEAVLTAGDGVGVGKVFHYHNGPFDFHQRVYMMNNFRKVSGPYFFHYLRENFYKIALEGGAKSTVDSLRRPMFMNFPVCVPPPPEQVAIVKRVEQDALQFDTLTAEAQRAIDLLQERRSALISAAVTGQIDVRHS